MTWPFFHRLDACAEVARVIRNIETDRIPQEETPMLTALEAANLRMDCLRLSISNVSDAMPATQIVESARIFYAFVSGDSVPAASSRERIDAELDAAGVR